MARIRSVHPSMFTNRGLIKVSALARLLYFGILTEADDAGAFEWEPSVLKVRILPVDNCDCAELMQELVRAELIVRYRVGGAYYGLVPDFGNHQRPRRPHYTYPVPDELRQQPEKVASPDLFDDHGDDEWQSASVARETVAAAPPPRTRPNPPDSATVTPFPTMSGIASHRRGEESRGGSELRSLPARARVSACVDPLQDSDFAKFWSVVPRHCHLAETYDAWRELLDRGITPDRIIQGVLSYEWGDKPRYIPAPDKWLKDLDFMSEAVNYDAPMFAVGCRPDGSPLLSEAAA